MKKEENKKSGRKNTMTTIIEKHLEKHHEGMDDYYKELILDQIERLDDKKPKCGRKQPMTIEQKLKERFGVLYSEDGSVSYRSKLKPNYGSNEKLRPRKGDY